MANRCEVEDWGVFFMGRAVVYQFDKAVEITYTEVGNYDGMNHQNAGRKKGQAGKDTSEENTKIRLMRAKKTIRRYILANNLHYHWTFTFNDSYIETARSEERADSYFHGFIKRLRYYIPDLKYVAVREYQKENDRYAIHYHVAINKFFPHKQMWAIWSNTTQQKVKTESTGFCWVTPHKTNFAVVTYLSKYLADEQENEHWETQEGNTKKTYLNSKGMVNSVERCKMKLVVWDDKTQKDFLNLIESYKSQGQQLWDIIIDMTYYRYDPVNGMPIKRTNIVNSIFISLEHKGEHSEPKLLVI